MKEIWKNKNFVKLWMGQLVSLLGDQIHFIALMVLIQSYYGNIVVTGTILMITAIPKVIFSPFAGVLIDRWPLKATMVVSDLIRMVLVASIPLIFHLMENPSMTSIFIITFLISTVSVFFYPAKTASIPTLVAKEQLLSANSVSFSTQQVVSLIGFLSGAVLVAVIGTTWAFILDAITFLISAIFILFIKYPVKVKTNDVEKLGIKRYVEELKMGGRYVFHQKFLRFLLLYLTSIMLIGGALNVLLFAYIEEVLQLEVSVFGYIASANMIGMIIGTLLLPKITKRFPKEKILVWSGFIFAFTVANLSWITQMTILLLIQIINGLGNGILNVVAQTMLQEYVRDDMRGRVFSVLDAVISTAVVISMLPAAWLAKQFGVTNVFLAFGIIIFFIALVSMKRINKLFTENATKKPLIEENNPEVNTI